MFEERCHEIMPFFHKNFYQNFGCTNKYLQTSNDITNMKCSKQEISTIWEYNVGVNIEDQTQNYGCLNQRCCVAMISFVKGKFNFLAAFCIVAIIFITVAIMNARYMYKKIKKFNTRILSHKRDDLLLGFMIGFTLVLTTLMFFAKTEGPQGMPQPQHVELSSYADLYSLENNRTLGIGRLDEEGWWNFERIDIFKSLDDSLIFEKHADVKIASIPANGEFRLTNNLSGKNITASVENREGSIIIKGTTSEVEEALAYLEFRPGCIFDPNLSLELNFTISTQSRELQSTNSTTQI